MGLEKLGRIEPVQMFEQVCDTLRHTILFGGYKPGEKLASIQELSKRLGVSQNTIREALRVLEAEGLIRARQGSGIIIAQQTLLKDPVKQYIDWLTQNEARLNGVLEVRESLEGLVTSRLAALASNEVILNLKKNVEAQQKLVEKLPDEVGEEEQGSQIVEQWNSLANSFHLIISGSCENNFADEVIRQIYSYIFDQNDAYVLACWRPSESLNEHKEILKWIEDKRPEKAAAAMRAHIRHGRQFIPFTKDLR